ncbi:MAG: metal ABC transporter permease [Chloroflexota bacterium]
MFSYPFMIRAFVAGSLLGALGGYFGAFVVQKRMGFLGNGLAHSAFGGVALGILLGLDPVAIAIPFTCAVALSIGALRRRTVLSSDTLTGILFSVSTALGILFLSLTNQYSRDAFAYLFGSILSVSATDVSIAIILAATALATLYKLWGRWAYAAFDEELAKSDGINVARDNRTLLLLLALVISVSLKIIGIVLVGAFLVIPASTARLVARSFAVVTWLAAALGAATCVVGLALSWKLDVPAGAAIVLLQFLVFLIAYASRRRAAGQSAGTARKFGNS